MTNDMSEERISVGTAGWSYPDWEEIVYPPGLTGAEQLRTLAEFLDCVEVDSSFYRPPTARTTNGWLRATSDAPHFRFLAKAWRRFTHERDSVWSSSEFARFTEGLWPLREAGRLAAVLFQFPWSFRNEPCNADWLRRIAGQFTGWPVAVELRHDSWAGEEPIGWLRRHEFIYCNVDQPMLSHCLGPTEIAIGTVGYYRLHGRNAQHWFCEKEPVYGARYDYLYTEEELDALLARMRRVAAKTQRMFVVFNNHKNAQAFANALQLKARARPELTVRAPATLLSRFPQLRGRVIPSGAEQLPLV